MSQCNPLPIDDVVMYRCVDAKCGKQFFSTERDAVCPCGARATLTECMDRQYTEHTVLEEVRALRRTIFALVSAAGGRAVVRFADMESAYAGGATLDCYYDHINNTQVWHAYDRPRELPAGVPRLN